MSNNKTTKQPTITVDVTEYTSHPIGNSQGYKTEEVNGKPYTFKEKGDGKLSPGEVLENLNDKTFSLIAKDLRNPSLGGTDALKHLAPVMDSNRDGFVDQKDLAKVVQAVHNKLAATKNEAKFEALVKGGAVKLSALLQVVEEQHITAKDIANVSPKSVPNVKIRSHGKDISITD